MFKLFCSFAGRSVGAPHISPFALTGSSDADGIKEGEPVLSYYLLGPSVPVRSRSVRRGPYCGRPSFRAFPAWSGPNDGPDFLKRKVTVCGFTHDRDTDT